MLFLRSRVLKATPVVKEVMISELKDGLLQGLIVWYNLELKQNLPLRCPQPQDHPDSGKQWDIYDESPAVMFMVFQKQETVKQTNNSLQ